MSNVISERAMQAAHDEIESLRRELENERARDIHSCVPDCKRSCCVNRRLREELAEARQEIAERKADCETGHDQDEATIAELRQQLKHMTDEYHAALEAEQVRYRQVVEKDAEIERLKFDLLLPTQTQLAASELQNKQLREAIRDVCCDPDGNVCIGLMDGYYADKEILEEALALPQDTAALEAMIAKAGEVMRNRMIASGFSQPHEEYFGCIIQLTIKSLPPITLKDLE